MNENIKKVAGIFLAGLACAGVGAAIGISAFPQVVTETQVEIIEVSDTEELQLLQQQLNLSQEQLEELRNQPPQIEKETVYVDNGSLDLVLEHIHDNGGQIEYLTDDLDDDEISLIVERIAFVNDIKELGARYVEDEFADELDRREFNGTEFDEDDVERVRVQDDHDEIAVDDIDFDDLDAELEYVVKFEHDDDDFEALVRVEVRDGRVKELDITEVNPR